MRLGEPAKMQAAINITPLVDVVLVLLIIFMVMAPQLRKGPEVDLPNTAKPREQGDERGKILVTIDEAGGVWINDKPVAPEDFERCFQEAAQAWRQRLARAMTIRVPEPRVNKVKAALPVPKDGRAVLVDSGDALRAIITGHPVGQRLVEVRVGRDSSFDAWVDGEWVCERAFRDADDCLRRTPRLVRDFLFRGRGAAILA